MKLCRLSDIKISPHRQRREFDPATLNELAESIIKNGLFHPVVVRWTADGPVLVSGERRLRAMQDIWALGGTFKCDSQPVLKDSVPFTTLGDLSPIAAEEAELEENLRRDDLTWQEEAEALVRLKSLREQQAAAEGRPSPTVADIAVEVRGSSIGEYQTSTREKLIVAHHLDDPEVRGAKSAREAFKILKRKEEAQRNITLAESVGKTFTSASHTALNVDALQWLADCISDSFDVILTDQPFGMGADEFGDSGVAGRRLGISNHDYKDDQETFLNCRSALLTHAFRITKPQAHLYWFCGIEAFTPSRDLFEAQGWWVHRTPLIWHKPNALRVPWPEHGPRRSYELILYAVKGKRPINVIAPDVITCPQDDNLGHSAQKPVALYQELLRRSVRPGDSVLDPFAGTGTLIPAAHELKCRATVLEKDPASFGIILNRIEALRAQKELAI